ncbi:cytochrome P450 [Pseudooceanicola sp. LIPI14-2-Ac024]|uniref:cytochrome P450 n=1 Tax=Pseudooceanicola sp. LIPI14-2-Ac024 TaxID=3344875 RepID=UPI0035CE9B91
MFERNSLVAGGPPLIDPNSLQADPHPRLAELRAHHPMVLIGENQFLILRADDVLRLLGDPATRQIEGPEYVALNRVPEGITRRFQAGFFMFSNGAAHRRIRGLFATSFAHRPMRALRADIRATADRIVAELPRDGSFDFLEKMAGRVPAEMIATVLGLPVDQHRYFAGLVQVVTHAITPIYPHQHHDEIEDATEALFNFVAHHLELRRVRPGADLLSRLMAEWQSETAIPFDSLVFQIMGLVVAGSDTTRTGLARMVSLLLERPADWDRLRAEPDLVPGAVAEALRFDPPVGSVTLVAAASVRVADTVLPAGSVLTLSVMSALRDPALCADPDRFDLARADHPRPHPAFGLGPHRCLGEVLARIEMEESLSALLADAPGLTLTLAPRMTGLGGLRQITPMRVARA